jgi:putative autoinducer-2 (AI-2) aldolase
MPDVDDVSLDGFHENAPLRQEGFFLKGSGSYDWGMKNRLARIFRPDDGRTVMLAIDHGYFQGPIRGLERVDVTIPPLLSQIDALMLTRGILRSTIPAQARSPVVLRASGGPSILKELSDEDIAVDMEDAVRLNVAAVAVQVYIGGEYETKTTRNLIRLVDAGFKLGIPVLGVTAVGRSLERDARYLRLACRICAELGAQFVKTYYVPENFETVTGTCPVPVVMAGGKKIEELAALKMVEHALQEGAAGVDMGRNVFQSAKPAIMLEAIANIVHSGWTAEQAYDYFQSGSR